jgi:hypothetical protein
MAYTKTNCAVGGRKDRLTLRKRMCRNTGLILLPTRTRLNFGRIQFVIAIPEGYSKARAIRVARAFKARPKIYKLSHVAQALCDYASRPVGPRQRRLWYGPIPRY